MLMSADVFKRLGTFIHHEFGIKMPEAKRLMLQSRLQKRLRVLNLSTFEEYCEYLFGEEGLRTELVHMIDMVSTNKTDFFREPNHFDYLAEVAVPTLAKTRAASRLNLHLWSAGCSSGEEPYTLAMVLSEYAQNHPGFGYSILATDISSRMLEMGRQAIYNEARVAPVPAGLRKKYLLRSKNPNKGVVRIVPELRERVQFQRLNFMDREFRIGQTMDIIFCRNVIIYFDMPTQERLLNNFCRCLSPDGYIFMGHSETLHGLKVPLAPVAPTVYRKR